MVARLVTSRLVAVAGLLAALAPAAPAGDVVPELFDPARIPLDAIGDAEFRALSARQQLRARGLEPELYRAPPPVTDSVAQANNIRASLFRGFCYGRRLEKKQRLFLQRARGLPADRLVRLLPRTLLAEPAVFAAATPAPTSPRDRRPAPLQPTMALRHSERQFHRWLAGELARRLNEEEPGRRARGLDFLIAGLEAEEPRLRVRCAEVLGMVEDAMAASALERAVAREEESVVLGALVHARAARGGARLPRLLERWAADEREVLRVTVVHACRDLGEAWVEPLLRGRSLVEQGRLKDDLFAALGEKPPAGPVTFYGIPTHSRRILFCIDVSGSMAYPLDGFGGREERRIDKTRRELLRTLGELPAAVRFNIALFAHGVRPWSRRLVAATGEQRERAMDFAMEALGNPRIVGGTNVHAILDFALRSGADTVFFLTDGEPSVGIMVDPALLIEEAAARNAYGRVVFHTVGLARDQNDELLVNLAARSGGRYVAVR